MVKRILLGIGDADDMEAATRYAREIAESHGAEITGIAVMDRDRLLDVGPVPLGGATAAHELREYRMAQSQQKIDDAIARWQEACDASKLRCRLIREEGDPLASIVHHARHYDLMVFALGGHVFEHGVIDEPPDALVQLVASGVRPILAVHGPYRPIRKVMIAYSGSMESAKTMRRYMQTRLWPDAKLQIVVFDKPEDEAQQLLAAAAEYCQAYGTSPETFHHAGDPRTELLKHAAAWDADLIVIGNSARSMLLRRLLGETALAVMRHTDRPFFTAQ